MNGDEVHSGGGLYLNDPSMPRAVSMTCLINSVEYRHLGYTGLGIRVPSVLLSKYRPFNTLIV